MANLKIEKLGRKGDGIALENGQDIFVPFTLVDELVEVNGSGPRREITSIVEASSDRIDPACKHFTVCGGCQLQHMAQDAYHAWKQALALEPFIKAGIAETVEPILSFDDASRRKVVFNLTRTQNGIALGFAERASSTIIAIEQCPVTAHEIIDRLKDLQELAVSIPVAKTGTRMSVLATNNGLDISVDGTAGLSADQRQVLIRKTIAHKFTRLTLDGETLIETKKPILLINDMPVIPPPGSFVQAVKQAESTMIDIVAAHLKPCKNVADLYSGIGTFALPLAHNSTVWAVEENKPALDALDAAWRGTAGKLKQVKTEVRNLERRPVSFAELKKFDGLVFDPPRAGAELQVKQIAKSRVQKIAAVSCNPVTLVRDLEILISGGFKLQKLFAIDQFKYTPHIEMIALLAK